jgi:uncharacterized protein (TIGR02118 family)
MATKITVAYDPPSDVDVAAFEARYPRQVAIARQIPNLSRLETSKVWPTEGSTPPHAYRFIDMYFVNLETANEAVGSEQAAAFFGDVFDVASGAVRIAFVDLSEEFEAA